MWELFVSVKQLEENVILNQTVFFNNKYVVFSFLSKVLLLDTPFEKIKKNLYCPKIASMWN